jgi:uncharacterized protein DUF4145
MAAHGIAFNIPSGGRRRIWGAFKCDHCNALSIATGLAEINDPLAGTHPAVWLEQRTDPEWYPIQASGREFPEVPQHIAEAATEAYRCHSISAFRASTQLARSVVEATAKEKGITQGSVFSKINELYNQRFIREHIKDGAHEVRHFGNDMAHGDFILPVTSEEAELVLTLMSEILEEVFQSPARVAKAQAARAAREAHSSGQQAAKPLRCAGSWKKTGQEHQYRTH